MISNKPDELDEPNEFNEVLNSMNYDHHFKDRNQCSKEYYNLFLLYV